MRFVFCPRLSYLSSPLPALQAGGLANAMLGMIPAVLLLVFLLLNPFSFLCWHQPVLQVVNALLGNYQRASSNALL
jgi:hypothetical protein